jgi:hypothetical protein
MRARNWVVSLALPLLAAIAVGIAVVVIVGANNNIGSAPTAIDDGFPPARLATADFGGGAAGSPVQLSAIAAAGSTEVAAGSARGGLALWVSVDGGSTWQRSVVTAAGGRLGGGQLAWVAHGPSGWLAVGDATSGAAAATPVVLGSADGRTWTAVGGTGTGTGTGTFAGAGRIVTAAVAAGGAGYVIVGHASVGARTIAAAWYAPGRTGWRRATDARPGALDGTGNRVMSAVTATSRGFAAVGAVGPRPAAWLSGTGRTWTLVTLPLPAGAASAALDYVAANGSTVAAVGTEVTAAGQRQPFDAVSTNAGATWTLAPLPVPGGGAASSATSAASATALTAAGGGFTATGTDGLPGETDVVVWTLPAGAAPGTAWTAVAPQGFGLSRASTQAITALTATGDTLTGVGFVTKTATGTATEPTIWQSPVRS